VSAHSPFEVEEKTVDKFTDKMPGAMIFRMSWKMRGFISGYECGVL
jgi:hypothetical protein